MVELGFRYKPDIPCLCGCKLWTKGLWAKAQRDYEKVFSELQGGIFYLTMPSLFAASVRLKWDHACAIKMCSKTITENSSGPNSGLGDEFSNKENRLCPEGFCSLVQEFQLLSPLTTSLPEKIICASGLSLYLPYTYLCSLTLPFLEIGCLVGENSSWGRLCEWRGEAMHHILQKLRN